MDITIEQVIAAIEEDSGIGFCMSCGEEQGDWVEPDVSGRECEECGLPAVMGAEQILLVIA